MRLGSEDRKPLFCHSFIDTYRPYNPHLLPWPDLNADQLQVLRGIPFWGEALKVETNAGIMVAAFAETVTDPFLREAIALQGREEARHALLLEVMMARYGIEVQRPEVVLPERLEAAFINLGHEECLFVNTCLEENQRRVSIMADELLRPRLMPALFSSIQLGWQLGSPARLRQRVSA